MLDNYLFFFLLMVEVAETFPEILNTCSHGYRVKAVSEAQGHLLCCAVLAQTESGFWKGSWFSDAQDRFEQDEQG